MKRTYLADSTRGKYEGLLRLHILPNFGKVELRRLTGAASMVRTWYYELDKAYPEGSTANDAYRCLRAIVNTAVADSRMSKSPCTVKRARTTEAAERPVAALGELDAAVVAIATRYKAGYAIAAWCQLRQGEILGLRPMDIDVKRQQLQVRLSWVMPPGATWPVLREPKSEAGKNSPIGSWAPSSSRSTRGICISESSRNQCPPGTGRVDGRELARSREPCQLTKALIPHDRRTCR